jgi:hypothetical protein
MACTLYLLIWETQTSLFPRVSFVLPFLSLSLSLFTPSFVSRSSFLPSSLVLRSCLLCLCFLCLCLCLSTLLFVSRSSFFPYKSFARLTSFACVSVSSFLIVQGFVFRKVSRARTFFWFFTDR